VQEFTVPPDKFFFWRTVFNNVYSERKRTVFNSEYSERKGTLETHSREHTSKIQNSRATKKGMKRKNIKNETKVIEMNYI
jgi:hypothetical protein